MTDDEFDTFTRGVYEQVLWVVSITLEESSDASPGTVTNLLYHALREPQVLWTEGAQDSLARNWHTVELSLARYLELGHDLETRSAREAIWQEIEEAFWRITPELAHGLIATEASTEQATQGFYESPSLSGAAHDDYAFTSAPHPAHARQGAAPVRDHEPGAAERRRTQRAQRALENARRLLQRLDWGEVDAQNGHLLKSLKVGGRLEVLWVKSLGRIVVGRRNPAFETVAAVQKIAGVGVCGGSLQLTRKPPLLGGLGRADVTGLPPGEIDTVARLFHAHKIEVSPTVSERWAR
ncbi:hypothetical protein [Streptomyces sp. NPDC047981]|uniref:hypothetical protein n=1 Tax=Streptomyces sp. NPDC047981 TaxID=3154610 RepID=UPI00343B58D8